MNGSFRFIAFHKQSLRDANGFFPSARVLQPRREIDSPHLRSLSLEFFYVDFLIKCLIDWAMFSHIIIQGISSLAKWWLP